TEKTDANKHTKRKIIIRVHCTIAANSPCSSLSFSLSVCLSPSLSPPWWGVHRRDSSGTNKISLLADRQTTRGGPQAPSLSSSSSFSCSLCNAPPIFGEPSMPACGAANLLSDSSASPARRNNNQTRT
ncbi:unnamed protein product, partial [Ectocarpus sp. 13 AM-2016]